MLSRLSRLRNLYPPFFFGSMAARLASRALPSATAAVFFHRHPSHFSLVPSSLRSYVSISHLDSSVFGRRLDASRYEHRIVSRGLRKVFASQRGYRKVRRRPAKSKEKELELSVNICIKEQLPDDPEILGSHSICSLCNVLVIW